MPATPPAEPLRRLAGRVAFVTGGGSGIGRAIALRLARDGAAVVVAQRDAAAGNATVDEIRADGGEGLSLRMDVRDEDEVRDAVAAATDAFGGLDVLCVNAGVGGSSPISALDVDHYREVVDTNVLGVLLCLKHGAAAMADAGSVVAIASLGSFRALPDSASYCASKSAVLGIVRTAAVELAPRGIRVNAVAPGFIDNEMFHRWIRRQPDPAAGLRASLDGIPLGRLGRVDDVAAAASFLGSDDAAYVTGQCLAVDGGVLAA
jgi:NAD(P)-dependent dehydrogenase (short-subunit alcohol dehydrogenase family)